jgi:glycosyltransferase involved in cell wall biosynthesis
MAGPMTWELAQDLSRQLGPIALLTGHPETLAKGSQGPITLFPSVPYDRATSFSRGLTWLMYLLHAFIWLQRWPGHIPCLLFSNPPLLPWLGYGLRRVRRRPYAVMIHDIYPDVLVRLKGLAENSWMTRLWRWLNRVSYEQADVVMTLGDCMAATLAGQFDPTRTKAGRLEIIHPWADTAKLRPLPKVENWFARSQAQVGKLTVMYSGNMGMGHDIETMLNAARRLRSSRDIHFMFIGAGPKRQIVADYLRQEAPANVTLLPWQPEAVVPFSLAAADVALVSLEAGAEGLAFPSKALSAMAAGSALLGLSHTPSDLQGLIEQFHCGLNIKPGDADGLVKAILTFRDDKFFLQQCRRKARLLAESTFVRDRNVRKVLETIGIMKMHHSVLTGALKVLRTQPD